MQRVLALFLIGTAPALARRDGRLGRAKGLGIRRFLGLLLLASPLTVQAAPFPDHVQRSFSGSFSWDAPGGSGSVPVAGVVHFDLAFHHPTSSGWDYIPSAGWSVQMDTFDGALSFTGLMMTDTALDLELLREINDVTRQWLWGPTFWDDLALDLTDPFSGQRWNVYATDPAFGATAFTHSNMLIPAWDLVSNEHFPPASMRIMLGGVDPGVTGIIAVDLADPSPVPEPENLLLVAMGLLCTWRHVATGTRERRPAALEI